MLPSVLERLAARIAGINNVSSKYRETGKLNLHFRADVSGLLHADKGEAVIDTEEEYTVEVGQ
jgi:DNA-binding Lrp family transcriptional regulator